MAEFAEEVIEQAPGLLRVRLPAVDGEYELTYSPSLVQAVGECSGVDFCFHAKHGSWELLKTEDEHGHCFPEGDPRRFVLSGRYDKQQAGGDGHGVGPLACCVAVLQSGGAFGPNEAFQRTRSAGC